MLNLYLTLSITSFKTKFQHKQLALYKSYASAQSGNPDRSWTFSCLGLVLQLTICTLGSCSRIYLQRWTGFGVTSHSLYSWFLLWVTVCICYHNISFSLLTHYLCFLSSWNHAIYKELMSAHVLLNLLNKLKEGVKCVVMLSILLLFSQQVK